MWRLSCFGLITADLARCTWNGYDLWTLQVTKLKLQQRFQVKCSFWVILHSRALAAVLIWAVFASQVIASRLGWPGLQWIWSVISEETDSAGKHGILFQTGINCSILEGFMHSQRQTVFSCLLKLSLFDSSIGKKTWKFPRCLLDSAFLLSWSTVFAGSGVFSGLHFRSFQAQTKWDWRAERMGQFVLAA